MSPLPDAFVGIDVAFATGKRLPVCVLVRSADGELEILPLRRSFEPPPAGRGNIQALDAAVRREFALEVLNWLRAVERVHGIQIRRIAIDAPSDYCRDPSGRRSSEQSLDQASISCFATPSKAAFEQKVRQAQAFLESGGPASHLPNANQFWMLIGFDLFRVLGGAFECLETYPQAIVRQLGCGVEHKSTEAGFRNQVEKAAELSGWEPRDFEAKLNGVGFGSRHDQLDAFLSAWVASLDETDRTAFGTPPLDAIWVPAMAGTGDTMTHKQQISALLSTPTRLLCDACIRQQTGISPHQAVNQATNQLAAAGLIHRAPGTCEGCAKPAKCNSPSAPGGPAPAPAQSTASSTAFPSPGPIAVPSTDRSKPWYWEGNVQAVVVAWLGAQQWTVTQAADTAAKVQGIDIIATRPPNKELWVTVKGFPEKSQYVQARHWFAGGIFDLVTYRNKSAEAYLAFALPDGYPTYTALAAKSAWLKKSMPFTIFWVSADGQVRSE